MVKFRKFILRLSGSKGLTLVEVLVVAGLIAFMTFIVIKNFSGSRLNLEQVANVLAADVRLAQQLAISSHQFQGSGDPVARNRCGYGITPTPRDGLDPENDNRRYAIFAGSPTLKPDNSPGNCGGSLKYQANQDQTFYKSIVLDSRLNFFDQGSGQAFPDMYFEPPVPTVYFDGKLPTPDPNDPTTYYQQLLIKKNEVKAKGGPAGSSCEKGNPDCIYVCVYVSGRVEISKTYGVCPSPF